MKQMKRGRKPLKAWMIRELKNLKKQGFSRREMRQISDLSLGVIYKYTVNI